MQRVIDVVIPAYNARQHIGAAIESIQAQVLPDGWVCNVYVVDDNSSDDTADYVRKRYKKQIHISIHESNRGRSAAINTGTKSGNGVYIVIVDSDCTFTSNTALAVHIKVLEAGGDMSIGLIEPRGGGFWARYQRRVFKDRTWHFEHGQLEMFTTANVAIRRRVFEEMNGFDECFCHYGFEDRDLIARLIGLRAKLRVNSESIVSHGTERSLETVCTKMRDAGQYTSGLFRDRHPELYSRMAYAKFDARLRPLRLSLAFGWVLPLLPSLIRIGTQVINSRFLSDEVKVATVKLVSALSFYKGTRAA